MSSTHWKVRPKPSRVAWPGAQPVCGQLLGITVQLTLAELGAGELKPFEQTSTPNQPLGELCPLKIVRPQALPLLAVGSWRASTEQAALAARATLGCALARPGASTSSAVTSIGRQSSTPTAATTVLLLKRASNRRRQNQRSPTRCMLRSLHPHPTKPPRKQRSQRSDGMPLFYSTSQPDAARPGPPSG